MESDNGVFNPKGYVLAGSDSAAAVVQQVAGLLQPINATGVQRVDGSPAADITPLVRGGRGQMEIDVDGSRYFWYHHSDGDTLDKLDPAELARCVAAHGRDGVRRRRPAGRAAALGAGQRVTLSRGLPKPPPVERPSRRPRYPFRDCPHAAAAAPAPRVTPIPPPSTTGARGSLDVRPPRLEAELDGGRDAGRAGLGGGGAAHRLLPVHARGRRGGGGLDRGAGLVLARPPSISASGPTRRTAQVHATLADRDKIGADDFVQILLGTFDDGRQAIGVRGEPVRRAVRRRAGRDRLDAAATASTTPWSGGRPPI